ncbi:MAG: hypothetical protein C0P78_000850 [Bacillota bacterium]
MLQPMVFRRAWRAAAVALALLLAACGGGSFDAQGLLFDYPEDFQQAEGTSRSLLILKSSRPEQGVLTVAWKEGGQPDAARLLAAALGALGADEDAFDDRSLETIEFTRVPGATAHYVEMRLRSSAQPEADGYFARLMVLEASNGFGYIVAHTVPAEHRDDAGVERTWDQVQTSLRFETQNARN